MDREERKRIKEKKRLMRRQRKEFLAEEKRSIRRQKHEMQKEIAYQRRKIRKAKIRDLKERLGGIFGFLSGRTGHKTASFRLSKIDTQVTDEPITPGIFPEPNKVKLPTHQPGTSGENLIEHEDKTRLRRQRKEFLAEERCSLKRERRERRKRIAAMRRKINAARIEGFRKNFLRFLRHPFGISEINKTDRKILKKIRREYRREQIQIFSKTPVSIVNSISKFWKNRFAQLQNIGRNLAIFFQLVKTASGQPGLRQGYFKTLINSLALFLLSFLLVYYVHQFATILTARIFNIPTKLYSYRIDWPLYTYSYLYSRRALIVIFGMGPLLCLLMGIGAYRLFLTVRFKTVFLKSFLLWTAFHAFNLFFGAYIVGVITRTGFIYTSEWLFLSNVFDVEEIVMMIVSIIVLLIAGYFSTRQFLLASDVSEIIEPRYRILYLMTKVLIPWLAGTLILYGVNIPKNPLELVMLYGTSSLIVFPIFSNYNTTTMQMLKLPHVPRKFRIGWIYILVTLAAIFATSVLLKSGISFY
jgi:hypothetical protein